jgi:hypothetical protein
MSETSDDYATLLWHGWVSGAWDTDGPGKPHYEAWAGPIERLAEADGLRVCRRSFVSVSWVMGLLVLLRANGSEFPMPPTLDAPERERASWLRMVERNLGRTLRLAREQRVLGG